MDRTKGFVVVMRFFVLPDPGIPLKQASAGHVSKRIIRNRGPLGAASLSKLIKGLRFEFDSQGFAS